MFARAREKARQSSCLSNIKQLTLASLSYAQDYDESVSLTNFDLDGNGAWSTGDMTWRTALLPYSRNVQIFFCPSDKAPTGTKFNGAVADHDQVAGYAVNSQHWLTGSPTSPAGLSLGAAEDSASVVLLWESEGTFSIGIEANTHGDVRNDKGARRHNDGQNLGFMDGHAKWMKPTVLCPASGDCLLSVELE